jgi:hypothetical protein
MGSATHDVRVAVFHLLAIAWRPWSSPKELSQVKVLMTTRIVRQTLDDLET